VSAAATGALGVIAGGGELPQRVAEAARADGRTVTVAALEGFADGWVESFPHVRAGLGEIGKIIGRFKADGVETVTFAGAVTKPNFAALKVDARGARELPRAIAAAAKGDDALLRFVLGIFEREGFTVAGADALDGRLVADQPGPIGRFAPGAEHEADIALALEAARALGLSDVGQGAVARAGAVIALEDEAGTDALLARVALMTKTAGAGGGRAGVLAKVPKPGQDRRVDLPTIGVRTVEGAARAGLAGVAVERGGALIVDRDAVAAAGDAAGIFVTVLPAPDASSAP
jgi:DUF1009 family protein